jgi:hypothetical protein
MEGGVRLQESIKAQCSFAVRRAKLLKQRIFGKDYPVSPRPANALESRTPEDKRTWRNW